MPVVPAFALLIVRQDVYEITIPSQDKYRKVPDIPDSDILGEQTLSNTQREDWLLPMEPMHATDR